jgi:fluoride exporter
MLKQLILVGIGGGAGSILRYMTSVWTAKYSHTIFPLATFIANIAGCLFIGIFIGYLLRNQLHPDLRFLLITGFCGGYTTFSTFAYENYSLLEAQHYFTVILYIILEYITWISSSLGRTHDFQNPVLTVLLKIL